VTERFLNFSSCAPIRDFGEISVFPSGNMI
jgi:hypothetical protein